MSQIICKNLCVGYKGIPAATNINFVVEKGDYVSIVGDNGSGKSTLIKTLLGLIKPVSGLIHFGGGINSSSIGYLPQYTSAHDDFPASVREIVRSGFLGKKKFNAFYSKAEKEKSDKIMANMGILELADRGFSTLSGGQRQRVLLARAMCACNGILVLDEPVSALDPLATAEMYQTVENLNKNFGITIIMISHDISAVEKYSNKVIRIGK